MSKLDNIKLKVCGMRDNIDEVVSVQPDLLGFIFYDKSPRFVDDLPVEKLKDLPVSIEKVGVFVNADLDYVIQMVQKYDLQYAQLHGDESVSYCDELYKKGISIIKVFGGNKDLSIDRLAAYAPVIDFYLFDTRTDKYGGTGHKFDWKRLKDLKLQKPIFLSGGIDLNNIDDMKEISELDIYAIDVNSKFEVSPGLKDVDLLKQLREKMNRKSA